MTALATTPVEILPTSDAGVGSAFGPCMECSGKPAYAGDQYNAWIQSPLVMRVNGRNGWDDAP
jgi:hypothetical protein